MQNDGCRHLHLKNCELDDVPLIQQDISCGMFYSQTRKSNFCRFLHIRARQVKVDITGVKSPDYELTDLQS